MFYSLMNSWELLQAVKVKYFALKMAEIVGMKLMLDQIPDYTKLVLIIMPRELFFQTEVRFSSHTMPEKPGQKRL